MSEITDPSERAHIARQRKKFEGWMRKKWGGTPLDVVPLMRHSFGYREAAAQTAWEVWQKFNPASS